MASDRERLVWCKHHDSPKPTEHACTRGHDPRDLAGPPPFGQALRLPCAVGRKHTPVDCPDRELPTAEEIAADDTEREKAVAEAIARIQSVSPMVRRIKDEHRGESASGAGVCPVCEGQLEWTHAAYNGHVSMACETPNCIRFME